MPWSYIRALQQGRNGTQLIPKLEGELGKEIGSNKGVSQGSPLRARPFTIYVDALTYGYDNSLPGEIKQTQHGAYGEDRIQTKSIDLNRRECANNLSNREER